MILYTCALSLILYFLMDEWEGKTMDGNIALTLMVCHRFAMVVLQRGWPWSQEPLLLVMGTSALSLMMQDSWSPMMQDSWSPHSFPPTNCLLRSSWPSTPVPHIIAGTFMARVVLNQLRWISVSALASLILQPHQVECSCAATQFEVDLAQSVAARSAKDLCSKEAPF